MKNLRHWLSGAFISGGAIVVGIMVLVLATIFTTMGQPTNVSATEPTPTATATPTAAATPKCTTWATAPSDYGNNRWFADGITEIKTAKTATQATNAAHVWLDEVRKDPNLLVGAVKYFLNVDVAKATLSSGGCATDRAAQLVTQMELVIGQSKVIAAVAPSNGTNTGVDKGVVVSSTTPAIGGDRKAIQFTLPDGRVIWIMARCGNIVTVGKSPLPPGKTDNQPTKQPTKQPTCPPGFVGTPPSCLESKIPSQDPFPQGNAPVGGGLNQDPGPGTYIPPAQMQQPPATVRVNPPPPAPVATIPPVGSTPDPAPAPAPEPSAPPPSAPATGTSCAPGIPVC